MRRDFGGFEGHWSLASHNPQRDCRVVVGPAASRSAAAVRGWQKSQGVGTAGLIEALEKLVDSGTRGDPESPLKWTIKSTRAITRELQRQKFSVGSTKVGELLKTLEYSLQANRKTIEGKQHPERNAQFEFIATRVR